MRVGKTNVLVPNHVMSAFCERNHIRKLALFGSALRGDFHSESDIDLLVEYEPGVRIGLLDIAGHEIELSHLFGRKVDLRTANDLSRYFRQQVLDQAITLYERV